MSAARLGKNWADVDEEDEEEELVDASKAKSARCFETPVDEHGIKTVIEYKERDGKTYKVSKRVKQTTVTKWSNADMAARKTMEKFGKAKTNDAATEAAHVTKMVEEVTIEVARKAAQQSATGDADDKFLEEALKACETLFKEKKVWTDINKEKQDAKDDVPAAAGAAAPAAAAAASGPAAAGGPSKYVPPSIRAAQAGGKGDGKGGKGMDSGVEASLRVTNLSDDIKEGDLQDLFSPFGRLQRVYLAKDMTTFLSKGFAFITYYNRGDAQKAIDKLNGHGYDNLIMQVMWAKPKA